jgi:hypothetical protein
MYDTFSNVTAFIAFFLCVKKKMLDIEHNL